MALLLPPPHKFAQCHDCTVNHRKFTIPRWGGNQKHEHTECHEYRSLIVYKTGVCS